MTKRKKKLSQKRKKKLLLDPKWELFCQFYTSNDSLFGNATHSYAQAYDYKLDELPTDDEQYEEVEVKEGVFIKEKIKDSSYDLAIHVCAQSGNRLLRNVDIQKRITELLCALLDDRIVDSQLAKVMMQDKELPAKVSAIKEYNSLRARTKNRIEITGKDGKPLFDEETKSKSRQALAGILG